MAQYAQGASQKVEGFESLFLEIKPMIFWMGIIVNEGRWKCVHLMLECSENLWLAFSNNHLPAVFTLTFGAEATIWWGLVPPGGE